MRAFVISFCFLALASTPLCAASGASKLVADTEKSNAEILLKFPGLQAVEDVVKADCSSKFSDPSRAKAFCECGAAVTMALWLTPNGDPTMRPRLAAYLSKPSPEAAAEFVKYQGPELYKPLCSAAGL